MTNSKTNIKTPIPISIYNDELELDELGVYEPLVDVVPVEEPDVEVVPVVDPDVDVVPVVDPDDVEEQLGGLTTSACAEGDRFLN